MSRELWVFNHYAAPPDRPAGTRHYDLGRGLLRRGYQVTVFAAGFSHATLREERLSARGLYRVEWHDGIRFVWLRTLGYEGNTWRRLANMLSYALVSVVVQARFPRPDVVIGSSVHPFAAAAACAIARIRRARFVFEIRDLWPQTLIDMGVMRPGSMSAQLLYRLEAGLVARAELVVTVLDGMADYLADRRLPAHDILYLPNSVRLHSTALAGAPPPALKSVLEAWRAEGRFILGYLGAHGRTNGLDVILDAAAQLQSEGDRAIGILLIGDGPEKERLTSRARQLGLKNVEFVDPIPKESVPATLRRLDAAIFHLVELDVFRYGVSPNKLFDYLANEVPVLFACRSRNDPIAESGAGISLPPQDPGLLAAAMRAIASLPEAERRRMGALGRRYVEEHHDSEILADRLADRLETPAAHRGRVDRVRSGH